MIGSFLLVLAMLLLGTHFFGPSDLVEGIALNLMAGLAMGAVGITLIVLGLVAEEETDD